ncbi:MAG: SagB/ThcOx family dehydrogenase [Clostridia bacterium]|nr:SagB/ThcOx family dehydrogenase [Clostridia bacterium]
MGKFDLIRTDWKKLESEETDQMKKMERPALFKEIPDNAVLIDLIPYGKIKIGNKPLLETIYDRRSKRSGSDQPLTLEELSYLLFCTNGVKNQARPMFRTVPSAGARHAIETYLQVERVETLKKGVYRYLPLTHQLVYLKEGSLNEAIEGFLGQNFNADVMFFWTAVPYRMQYRYGSASEKLILLDAGHVCQNLYLACDAIGLGACAIGAYDQEKLDWYLELDTEKEVVIYNATVVK